MYIYICIYTSPYAFFAESMNAFTGVVEHHACAGVYIRQMLWISAYTFASPSLQERCAYALCIHMCICIRICIYIWVCMYICIYVCMCIRIYAYICGCVYVCICMYMCIYMYVWMYMYVYIYMYMALYRMYVQFVSFSIGIWGWGVSTSLWERLFAGVGGYFWQKEKEGCCLCLLYF